MESLLRESIDGAQVPRGRELTPAGAAPATRPPLIAVVGLGYVGLPTALALRHAGHGVLGIEISEHRLNQIRRRRDLTPEDHERLLVGLDQPQFDLTREEARLSEADAVMICVPARALRRACEAVCRHARRGQTIVLTSTSYVGTTRDLLVEPLSEAGFEVGCDICVAFSPERIDPANTVHPQESAPRVLGAESRLCAEKARAVIDAIAPSVHVVSSPEAAEIAKLHISLANELAEAARVLGLSPTAIT